MDTVAVTFTPCRINGGNETSVGGGPFLVNYLFLASGEAEPAINVTTGQSRSVPFTIVADEGTLMLSIFQNATGIRFGVSPALKEMVNYYLVDDLQATTTRPGDSTTSEQFPETFIPLQCREFVTTSLMIRI